MTNLDALRHDHEVLRRVGEALEHTLAASASSAVTCQLCATLVRLLEQHLQREQAALAPHAQRLQVVLHHQCCSDHADPRVVLRDLRWLLAPEACGCSAAGMVHLHRLLEELREEFAEEEREVFPLVESAHIGAPAWSDGLKKAW